MRRRMRRRDRWGGLGSERGVCRERDERRTSRHLDENPLACMCATTRRTPSDVALSQHVLAPYSVQNVSPRFRAGGLPARAKSGAPACDTHVFLSAAAAPGTRSAARSAASANQTDVRIARVVAQCRSAHHPAGWIVHSHVWSRLVVRNSSSERASLGEPETRASTNFNRCSNRWDCESQIPSNDRAARLFVSPRRGSGRLGTTRGRGRRARGPPGRV